MSQPLRVTWNHETHRYEIWNVAGLLLDDATTPVGLRRKLAYWGKRRDWK